MINSCGIIDYIVLCLEKDCFYGPGIAFDKKNKTNNMIDNNAYKILKKHN